MRIILLVSLCFIAFTTATLRPIIGIVALPTDGSETKYGNYYIAASYVKFIESAGGRVVPIRYDASTTTLDSIFKEINGVLFTGGSADISVNSKLYNTAKYIVDLAKAANDMGDYFPIQAHCLGFELLSTVIAQNGSILEPFDSENLSLPLKFYDAYQDSRIFGKTDPQIIDILQNQPVTMNNHHYGVSPTTYSTNSALTSFFRVISWDYDRGNKQFVSTVEGYNYPIYALQWHPEKAAFEWNPNEGIDHTSDSIRANEYMAQFFVSEARKSNHGFATPEAEYKALIYNYSPIYSASFDSDFIQMYFFQ
jgi:gamma-glutamyl hydrolase